jgi:hypothetical protein
MAPLGIRDDSSGCRQRGADGTFSICLPTLSDAVPMRVLGLEPVSKVEFDVGEVIVTVGAKPPRSKELRSRHIQCH